MDERSAGLLCQRSLDDLFDHSSAAVSPCDAAKNVMVDLRKIGDVSSAGASAPVASVSTADDVYNRVKKKT